MPYGNQRETSLPITFHLTGEDAIQQNDDWERRFALTYADEDGNEQLWELAGNVSGAFATVRETPNNESPHILFLHTSNGGVVLGPTGAGDEEQFSFKLVIAHDQTSDLGDIGKCYWDIYVLLSDGKQKYLYRGDAGLARNIT